MSGAMTIDAKTWITRFAAVLGTPPPSDDEVAALLDLAGAAAHASERTAAPISCWLAARAGTAPADAARQATELAEAIAAEAED